MVGSSPRMRGTLAQSSRAARVGGIIPAYAGNTNPRQLKRFSARDHPRVCGEHALFLFPKGDSTGSSPRMRGTPDLGRALAVREGIIPAYAGNTKLIGSPRTLKRDHPRVCGEHSPLRGLEVMVPGSSPRMRGTLGITNFPTFMAGIIPAYAGNTGWGLTCRRVDWDHPRVCGEHFFGACARSHIQGSSPRMRGTQSMGVPRESPNGIIPAYAGNTVGF